MTSRARLVVVGSGLAVLVALAAVAGLFRGAGDTLGAYRSALSRSLGADAYGFDAEVRAASSTGTLVVTLTGTVDGQDRRLTVTTDQETSTVKVQDGVATIDHGEGPQQVPAEQAAQAPSLRVLTDLQDLRRVDATTVVGTLPTERLVAATDGTGVSGAGEVTVSYEPGGVVTGYVIRALDGRYRASVSLDHLR